MAAPMRLASAWLTWGKHLHTKRTVTTNAYYVLPPEVPADTPQNNTLLQMEALPSFATITPSSAVSACAKLAIEYDIAVEKHCQNLKENNVKRSFDDVFLPIERALVPLNYATSIARHLSLVKSKDYLEAYRRIHLQVESIKKEKFTDPALYTAIKSLESQDASLTSFQKALIRLYLLECKVSGAELSATKKDKFMAVVKKLSSDKSQFRRNVTRSASLFKHTIIDPAYVAEMPAGIMQYIAADKNNPGRGPWHITLQPAVYSATLSYCCNRELRWNAWQAYNNRASTRHSGMQLNNNVAIGTIRQQRQDAALMLGYPSYSEMTMESKMAGTIENVLNALEGLRQHFRPKAQEELEVLQQFAASEGFTEKLQPWDISYYRRHQCEALHGKNRDFEDYFPFPVVLRGLFDLCKKLFGITIVKLTASAGSTWHPTVEIFEVYTEAGKQAGYFYVDPYARLEQKLGIVWMDSCRGRSGIVDLPSLSTLSLSISPPLGKRPALMSPSDVALLCHQFGQGLQQLLCEAPYSDIHGQRGIAQDAANTCGKVLQGLAFRSDSLKKMSCHWENGKTLSDSGVQHAISAMKHMHATDICERLYLSAFDMEMHSSKTHWNTAMKRLWPQFMAVPLNELDNHPCSMVSLFGEDRLAGSMYSYIWSDIVAASLLKVFSGAPDDDSLSAVGRRFRDIYLYGGSGISATEACRSFCGHDPQAEIYLKGAESCLL